MILLVKLNLSNHQTSIICPNTNRGKQESEKLYQTLQEIVSSITNKEKTLVLVDYNGFIGDKIVTGIKEKFSVLIMNVDSGGNLIEFC